MALGNSGRDMEWFVDDASWVPISLTHVSKGRASKHLQRARGTARALCPVQSRGLTRQPTGGVVLRPARGVESVLRTGFQPCCPHEAPTRDTVVSQTGVHPISTELAALIGLVVAAAFAVGALLYARSAISHSREASHADDLRQEDLRVVAEQDSKAILLAAKEEAARRRDEGETEIRERRAEVARLEQRTNQREEGIERRLRELDSNEQRLGRRETELEALPEVKELIRFVEASERGVVI